MTHAGLAVVCRGGRSHHEHSTRYAYCGSSSAPAPRASARHGGIAAGLIFLSLETNATERMKEVNKAYEVLGDAEFSDCFETLFARPGGRARRAGGAAHVARGTNGASPAAEA